MTRILLVNTYYRPHYGGVETTLIHIAATLRREGHEPVVITSDRGVEAGSRLPAREEIEGVPVYRFRLPRRQWVLNLLSIWDEFRGAGGLARKLHREAPFAAALVRSHVAGLGVLEALGRDVPVLYIPPAAVWIQSAPEMINRSGTPLRRAFRAVNTRIQFPAHTLLQKRLLRKARMVWVFSEVMRTQVQPFRGPGPLQVEPPGVDLVRFRPSEGPRREELRRERGGGTADLIALCLARLVPQKGIEAAIGAMARLPASSRWVLWIVGDGPERDLLAETAGRLGVSGKVRFFPPTPVPEEWYAAADLFLMTSRYEPFGQTLLEAQAAGLPVAGFQRDDAAGILNANAEVVRHAETGWLVPFGEDPLGELLHELEGGPWPEERRESRAARAWVESRFNWERFCRRMMEAFARSTA